MLSSSLITDLALRACLVYGAGLIIIRVGKNRLLGRTTAFDIVLAFILGSLLSRTINGDAPLAGSLVAAVTLVALHWVIAEVACRWKRAELLIKGRRMELVRRGEMKPESMHRAEVSTRDLHEAMRLSAHLDDVTALDRAYLERNGEISVIPRRSEAKVIEVEVQPGVQTVRIELT